MQIRIGYRLAFDIPAPTPLVLLTQVYPNRYHFTEPEQFMISPVTNGELFLDVFGNRAWRTVAFPGSFECAGNGVVAVSDLPDAVDWHAVQHPVNELPLALLPYLMASRYCEVDRLGEFAWQHFGNGPTGYQRVQAVCAFVHNYIQFGYAFARSTKTAHEAFSERQGVCRDFAHLSIALCRCLGIPARYATGYLGDIGVPYSPSPMDFSAWFEVYLSGTWHTFDARHNQPRIGRIVMAYGRDAADTAMTTSFGPTTLRHFEVWTNQV